jgi:hypothetical protein
VQADRKYLLAVLDGQTFCVSTGSGAIRCEKANVPAGATSVDFVLPETGRRVRSLEAVTGALPIGGIDVTVYPNGDPDVPKTACGITVVASIEGCEASCQPVPGAAASTTDSSRSTNASDRPVSVIRVHAAL